MKVDSVVIGAGFAGLYMVHRLRQAGRSVQGFEAASDVGGTWYWNRYPGARCDVDSVVYSYSFSDELLDEWQWTERYAAQPEILSYLEHVADRLDLRRSFAFDTRVVSAHYDESNRSWIVRTDADEVVEARFLITAVGNLSARQVPDIPGLDSFGGVTVHTGAWPHEGVELAGRQVGVVGTGSSAVQMIPVIAPEVDRLTVFQRTPQYSIPGVNAPITPEEQKDLHNGKLRELIAKSKVSETGALFDLNPVSALEVTEAERHASWEADWEFGGAKIGDGGYWNLVVNDEANALFGEWVRKKIRQVIKDPEMARKLEPADYPIGAKRLLIDHHYFETFNRDNVDVVDLRVTPIVTVEHDGIRTTDGTYPLDVLVLATGYDAITGALTKIDIRGRDGLELREKWAAGPETYLGIAMAGFPNLFMITGPGSPAVLTNVPRAIEQHVDWISDLIETMIEKGLSEADPDPSAEKEWTEHVDEVANSTVMTKADSWFMGTNIPGKPRRFMAYLGGLNTYRKRCEEIAAAGYEGLRFS